MKVGLRVWEGFIHPSHNSDNSHLAFFSALWLSWRLGPSLQAGDRGGDFSCTWQLGLTGPLAGEAGLCVAIQPQLPLG